MKKLLIAIALLVAVPAWAEETLTFTVPPIAATSACSNATLNSLSMSMNKPDGPASVTIGFYCDNGSTVVCRWGPNDDAATVIAAINTSDNSGSSTLKNKAMTNAASHCPELAGTQSGTP